MNKIKTALILSFLTIATLGSAQSLPPGKLNAFTKQNPAFPVQLTYCSVTPIDGDLLLIAYIVQGHGSYQCFEVFKDEPAMAILIGSGRATEQPTLCYIVISRDNFGGCFFDLFNVHGYGGPEL